MFEKSPKKVIFLTSITTHYRAPFHNKLKEILGKHNISYELVSGVAAGADAMKGDTVMLDWSEKVREIRLNNSLRYHPVLMRLLAADMVIVTQENKYLINYILQLLPRRFRPIIGMMGHGRNFQAKDPDSIPERWKAFWATKVDWWFAYTNGTRDHLLRLGFPAENITVFNNSVDTRVLSENISSVCIQDIQDAKAELGIKPGPVGIFIGGLYEHKRLEHLIRSCESIKRELPNFQLIVAGGGIEANKLAEISKDKSWIIATGPIFGLKKATLLSIADLYMMPGLVGLGILDAATAGVPILTTNYPWHSPEISYLEDGVTGVIVNDWQDSELYAKEAVKLLKDEPRLRSMSNAMRLTAGEFSIENMSERFSIGIVKALSES